MPDELRWVGFPPSKLNYEQNKVLSFEPGLPYDDWQFLYPEWGEIVLSFLPVTELYPPDTPKVEELTILAVCSREDAGLIMTITRTGGISATKEEIARCERYKLGDGKIKWAVIEVEIVPNEDE